MMKADFMAGRIVKWGNRKIYVFELFKNTEKHCRNFKKEYTFPLTTNYNKMAVFLQKNTRSYKM